MAAESLAEWGNQALTQKSHSSTDSLGLNECECVRVCDCARVQMYVTWACIHRKRYYTALEWCMQPLHTLPAGETQSLHFKDSTPLSCYSVRSESQLHSPGQGADGEVDSGN